MTKWISVKDKLPEQGEDVLILRYECGLHFADIGEWSGKGWEVFDGGAAPCYCTTVDDVRYWFPIPDPPKAPKQDSNRDGATIGERIRLIRKGQNLTQQQLAGRLGCTQERVNQYEEDRSTLKLDTVMRIASALNVNPSDIDSRLKDL